MFTDQIFTPRQLLMPRRSSERDFESTPDVALPVEFDFTLDPVGERPGPAAGRKYCS